jgi:hypothetical protein
MAQTLVVACPLTWDLDFLRTLVADLASGEPNSLVLIASDELYIRAPDNSWYVAVGEMGPQADVAHEYATNEELDPGFRTQASLLRYFMLRFNAANVARAFLYRVFRHAAMVGAEAWLDTGYGSVLSASQVAQLIERDPKWSWVNSPS